MSIAIEVYSFGYKNNRFSPFAEKLREENFDAVIDTRYNPHCYDGFWKKKSLEESLPLYGIKYFHLKELGNKNYYSSDKPIEIQDIKTGITRLHKNIKYKKFNKICLLCVCENFETCHNRIIINILKKNKSYVYKGRLK